MLRTKLSEDKLKEKQRLYTRLQNCETLVTTRVNAEIWAKLQSHTRSVDIRLQKVQALLLKDIVPILQIANTQLSSDGGQNENHKEMTRQALDAISLLSQANQELNDENSLNLTSMRNISRSVLNMCHAQIIYLEMNSIKRCKTLQQQIELVSKYRALLHLRRIALIVQKTSAGGGNIPRAISSEKEGEDEKSKPTKRGST
jgi:hypothetical protein